MRIEEIKNAIKYIAGERNKLWYEYRTWKSINPDNAEKALKKHQELIKVIRGLSGSLGALKRTNKRPSEINKIKRSFRLFEEIMGYDLLKYSNRELTRTDANIEYEHLTNVIPLTWKFRYIPGGTINCRRKVMAVELL